MGVAGTKGKSKDKQGKSGTQTVESNLKEETPTYFIKPKDSFLYGIHLCLSYFLHSPFRLHE
jgi:hypothetical protein